MAQQPPRAPAFHAPTTQPAFAMSSPSAAPRWSATQSANDGRLKLTPLHYAILISLVAVAMVIARGAPTNGAGNVVAVLPTEVAATAGGSAVLPLKRKPAGIPSPASAASVDAERHGTTLPLRRNRVLKLRGMPSAAAAATLAPHTLPLRPSDGMTMPRSGLERDDHAVERHYQSTLPMERAVERPAVTPGDAARMSESARDYEAATGDLYGGASTATPANANMAF